MSIEITIQDNSKEFLDELENRIPVALEECGLAAEGYAKKSCVADTGLLRNSITHALSGEAAAISEYTDDAEEQHGWYSGSAPKAKENEMSVYIGTNVEYAPYVEMGTKRMKERPFLKPAVADHEDEYKKIIENRLNS